MTERLCRQAESPLFGFDSLQRLPTETRDLFCRRRPAFGFIPLQRFCCALAVLGATPLRRRLTSFAPATVDGGFRSCVTGLFLGDVPLSAPDGFGLADSLNASVKEANGSTTLLGFVDPSQLYSCRTGEWSVVLIIRTPRAVQ